MVMGNGIKNVRLCGIAAIVGAAITIGTASAALGAPVAGLAAIPEDLGRADARVEASKRFVPGEVVIRFERGVSDPERAELRRDLGAELQGRSSIPRVELLALHGGISVREAVAGLESEPVVEYAEPNFIRRAAATFPDDGLFPLLWGLHNFGQEPLPGSPGTPDSDIDAPEAWDTTQGDSSIIVAVIDSGVAYDHVDVLDNIWINDLEQAGTTGVDDDVNGFIDDVNGWDFVPPPIGPPPGDNDPADENGHGTHVAGTIGARGNNAEGVTGVNWQVSLMPLRILDPFGSGTSFESAQAIDYAADNGARVVNGSYSGSGFSTMEKDAIDAASDVLFVFAAGNDGTNNDVTQQTPCNYDSPNIICVAASNQDDQLAGFSNFGATNVDLAAPGTLTASTWPFNTRLFDDLEGGLGNWTLEGSWGLTTEFSTSPDNSLADSPGADYVPSADTSARLDPVDLTGETGCGLRSQLRIDTEPGDDVLTIEADDDGSDPWTVLDTLSGADIETGSVLDLTSFEGAPVHIRFHFQSDADTAVGDGVFVDDVEVLCREDLYAFLGGTSMATPHVAGTAALLFSPPGDESVAQVRSAILNSVDQLPALCGEVATAGRLNAARALAGEVNPPPCQPVPPSGGAGDTTPPETQITRGPKEKTKKKQARFQFTSSEPGSSFDCMVDGRNLKTPCTSPVTVKVKKGRHIFQVGATDASGNADPTPASDTWKRKKRKK
jgi:thermitase